MYDIYLLTYLLTYLLSFLLDQCKLIFWYRVHCSNNALSRLHQNRLIAICCKYGIELCVKEAVWRIFAVTVTL